MKLSAPLYIIGFLLMISFKSAIIGKINRTSSLDSLGACQGISYQNGKYFLYGDREVGVMRSYRLSGDSLAYDGIEYKFTVKGENAIKHPTGIAYHKGLPTFVGNSVRLNPEGTKWKAVINQINWEGFLKKKTLDENLISTIDDDACIQGTRPEYVKHKGKWFVATADYGNKNNEVRLYEPKLLAKAKSTNEKGILVTKFSCSPWVQNLFWLEEKGILVLVQNQIEGRKWRLTFLDLEKSIADGKEAVIDVIDTDKADELEGFVFTDNTEKGIAVSSSKKNNVSFMNFGWFGR
ncbi:hypothetical protein [Pedobacter aquatilis]|uniref:hypothetical protein n=1 Tax=Pedobacter aquatilis TaxID=351343 RepID=UPI0029303A27|nr:hypothetical protein [Pedobacter aquatilis]